MQPRIDEVKYVSERSLDALGEEITRLLKNEKDHWELFGDIKVTDKEYIQTMIHVNFPESMPEIQIQTEPATAEK